MKKVITLFFLALAIFYSDHLFAFQQKISPKETVDGMLKEVFAVLRDCPGGKFSLRAQKSKLFDIASRYVDLDEVAPRVVGVQWSNQPPEKREEFKKLFREIVFESYIDRLDSYKCKNETVYYEAEIITGSNASVRTRVKVENEPDIVIEYRLKGKNVEWKIYDVVIEGISVVQNYRSQFSEILRNRTFDYLLEMLRKKVQAKTGVETEKT